MGGLEVATTGEYRDERLFILETLKRLEQKNDQQIEKAGSAKEVTTKLTTDVNRLGSNVRALQSLKGEIEKRVLSVEVKAAYIAVASGSLVAGAFELARFFFTRR